MGPEAWCPAVMVAGSLVPGGIGAGGLVPGSDGGRRLGARRYWGRRLGARQLWWPEAWCPAVLVGGGVLAVASSC